MPHLVCTFTNRFATTYRCIATHMYRGGDVVFTIERLVIDALDEPAWGFVDNINTENNPVFHALLSAIELGTVVKTVKDK